MTNSDLIWNLITMLIDRIEIDSKKEENSNDKDE